MTKQELLARTRPISFNAEMIKAILDNKKTVTRRTIKPSELKPKYKKGEILHIEESKDILLRITNIGAEQIHDITDEKAISEGFSSAEQFGKAIFKIYPNADGNTFVWVYEFEWVRLDD